MLVSSCVEVAVYQQTNAVVGAERLPSPSTVVVSWCVVLKNDSTFLVLGIATPRTRGRRSERDTTLEEVAASPLVLQYSFSASSLLPKNGSDGTDSLQRPMEETFADIAFGVAPARNQTENFSEAELRKTPWGVWQNCCRICGNRQHDQLQGQRASNHRVFQNADNDAPISRSVYSERSDKSTIVALHIIHLTAEQRQCGGNGAERQTSAPISTEETCAVVLDLYISLRCGCAVVVSLRLPLQPRWDSAEQPAECLAECMSVVWIPAMHSAVGASGVSSPLFSQSPGSLSAEDTPFLFSSTSSVVRGEQYLHLLIGRYSAALLYLQLKRAATEKPKREGASLADSAPCTSTPQMPARWCVKTLGYVYLSAMFHFLCPNVSPIRALRWMPNTADIFGCHCLVAVLCSACISPDDPPMDSLCICSLEERSRRNLRCSVNSSNSFFPLLADQASLRNACCQRVLEDDTVLLEAELIQGPWSIQSITVSHPCYFYSATLPPVMSETTTRVEGSGRPAPALQTPQRQSAAAAAFRSARAPQRFPLLGIFLRPSWVPYAPSALLRAAPHHVGSFTTSAFASPFPQPSSSSSVVESYVFCLYTSVGEVARCVIGSAVEDIVTVSAATVDEAVAVPSPPFTLAQLFAVTRCVGGEVGGVLLSIEAEAMIPAVPVGSGKDGGGKRGPAAVTRWHVSQKLSGRTSSERALFPWKLTVYPIMRLMSALNGSPAACGLLSLRSLLWCWPLPARQDGTGASRCSLLVVGLFFASEPPKSEAAHHTPRGGARLVEELKLILLSTGSFPPTSAAAPRLIAHANFSLPAHQMRLLALKKRGDIRSGSLDAQLLSGAARTTGYGEVVAAAKISGMELSLLVASAGRVGRGDGILAPSLSVPSLLFVVLLRSGHLCLCNGGGSQLSKEVHLISSLQVPKAPSSPHSEMAETLESVKHSFVLSVLSTDASRAAMVVVPLASLNHLAKEKFYTKGDTPSGLLPSRGGTDFVVALLMTKTLLGVVDLLSGTVLHVGRHAHPTTAVSLVRVPSPLLPFSTAETANGDDFALGGSYDAYVVATGFWANASPCAEGPSASALSSMDKGDLVRVGVGVIRISRLWWADAQWHQHPTEAELPVVDELASSSTTAVVTLHQDDCTVLDGATLRLASEETKSATLTIVVPCYRTHEVMRCCSAAAAALTPSELRDCDAIVSPPSKEESTHPASPSSSQLVACKAFHVCTHVFGSQGLHCATVSVGAPLVVEGDAEWPDGDKAVTERSTALLVRPQASPPPAVLGLSLKRAPSPLHATRGGLPMPHTDFLPLPSFTSDASVELIHLSEFVVTCAAVSDAAQGGMSPSPQLMSGFCFATLLERSKKGRLGNSTPSASCRTFLLCITAAASDGAAASSSPLATSAPPFSHCVQVWHWHPLDVSVLIPADAADLQQMSRHRYCHLLVRTEQQDDTNPIALSKWKPIEMVGDLMMDSTCLPLVMTESLGVEVEEEWRAPCLITLDLHKISIITSAAGATPLRHSSQECPHTVLLHQPIVDRQCVSIDRLVESMPHHHN